ncbi:MAG: hypothetical protein ACMUIG_08640 [Thermoplasmatota archaeon]
MEAEDQRCKSMKGEIISVAVLSLILIVCGCTSSSTSDDDQTFDEESAMEFSLVIVQTYFDNDMDEFLSFMADTVYTLEAEGPYTKSFLQENYADNEYVVDEDFADFTMEQYLETYEPRILDHVDVEDEFPGMIQDLKDLGWDYNDDDYLFLGHETKTEDESPLWEDPLIFVISHESGVWRFKAFSG